MRGAYEGKTGIVELPGFKMRSPVVSTPTLDAVVDPDARDGAFQAATATAPSAWVSTEDAFSFASRALPCRVAAGPKVMGQKVGLDRAARGHPARLPRACTIQLLPPKGLRRGPSYVGSPNGVFCW